MSSLCYGLEFVGPQITDPQGRSCCVRFKIQRFKIQDVDFGFKETTSEFSLVQLLLHLIVEFGLDFKLRTASGLLRVVIVILLHLRFGLYTH